MSSLQYSQQNSMNDLDLITLNDFFVKLLPLAGSVPIFNNEIFGLSILTNFLTT